ncbi:hypothetical protein GY45DRAFT_1259707 [Cubamyces sp. BRFM 1775]|nr:hypothetical protein GY45DRAFT_1259707 [Cubamyces sp. BRFM 1775]
MPVDTFIDTFLKESSADRSDFLSPKKAFNAVPQRADSAAEIYDPLVVALRKSTKNKSRCPGFVFDKSIERSTRPSRLGYTKPHICCFTPANLQHVQQADPTSRLELAYAELIIQVAPEPSLDYFIDPDTDADNDTLETHDFVRNFEDEEHYKGVVRSFGLHISFASEVFSRQHRTFLFTVSLAGSQARLCRWDRSGCIVSRAFDVREQPDTLAEFLWRFSKLSEAGRGYDSTFRMASTAEEDLFRDTIRAHVEAQLDVAGEELQKALSAHYHPGHVAVVSVVSLDPSESEDHTRYFLVSRPIISPLAPEGRGTRGYWCVDASTGRVCFLKDTWRTYARKGSEGEVLQRLNELAVRNVPIFTTHGDVLYDGMGESTSQSLQGKAQDTRTDDFVDESWARRIDGNDVIVSKRRHYRLVTYTVGYSLKTLRGTEELLHATYDVFVAMRDAITRDRRIHRDLSVGNIILVKEPGQAVRRGYLIDWDASIRVDGKGEALEAGRAGTWAFMSIRMLSPQHATTKHTFEDDMEALLYVVLYCSLLYLPLRMKMSRLDVLHEAMFQNSQEFLGTTIGGTGKAANCVDRMWTGRVQFLSPSLQEWLDTVMNYHSPLKEVRLKYVGMWEPDKLDAFWSDFLSTHELERDNRTVNKLSMASYYDSASPPTDPPTPPRRSRTLVRQRSDDIDETSSIDHADLPEVKRSRLSYNEPVRPRTRASGGRAIPAADVPLRRSQRIRDQQNKPQAAAMAVLAPSAGPSSPRKRGATSARSRGRGQGRGRGRK